MSKLSYNLSEVTELTGRARSTLYEAIAVGSLKAKKSGRSTIVLAADLQAFLNNLPDATAARRVRARKPEPIQQAA